MVTSGLVNQMAVIYARRPRKSDSMYVSLLLVNLRHLPPGGSLCRWESGQEAGEVLPITLPSPQFHVQRKFVYGSEEWEDLLCIPRDTRLLYRCVAGWPQCPLGTRSATAWQATGARYRLPTYLADG